MQRFGINYQLQMMEAQKEKKLKDVKGGDKRREEGRGTRAGAAEGGEVRGGAGEGSGVGQEEEEKEREINEITREKLVQKIKRKSPGDFSDLDTSHLDLYAHNFQPSPTTSRLTGQPPY